MRWQFVLTSLVISLLLSTVQPAHGQGYGPRFGSSRSTRGAASRYGFSRPTFSPYFNLFRRDFAPLGNYHSFVRPQQRLQQTLRQQSAGLQRQHARINTLGQQVSGLERPAAIRPTGTGSVFMNYSHYYPLSRLSGGRR